MKISAERVHFAPPVVVLSRGRCKKRSVQFYLGSDRVVKYRRPASSAYVGNSCKESTSHPNIRQYTDTRCQSVPRVRGSAARLSRTDWRLGFIHHPRRDAISAIFTRKASRDVLAARSSNKAQPSPARPGPSYGVRTCARLSRVGAVARISSRPSPRVSFMCRRTRPAVKSQAPRRHSPR